MIVIRVYSILANSPPPNQHKLFTGFQNSGNSSMVLQQQLPHQQQQFYQTQNSQNLIAGPSSVGLFDYLKNDKSFQTPTKNFLSHHQSQNMSNVNQQSFDGSYQSGFNQSRIMSPIANLHSGDFNQNSSFQTTIPATTHLNVGGYINNLWITVFGFPQNAVSAILSHFSQCGSVLEKVCSSGNWIHLKFSSRLECDKALLYNGKIICNNLMIGVMRCTDENILDKENLNEVAQRQSRDFNVSKIRSLTNAAYKSAQEPSEVVLSPNAPKKTTGLVNKTLDIFFGW